MLNQRRYRPLGVSDIFDEAFDLYKSNWLQFVACAACVEVPIQAVAAVYLGRAFTQFGADINGIAGGLDDAMALFSRLVVAMTIVSGITVLGQLVFCGPTIYLIGQRYLDRPVRISTAYRLGLRKAASLTVAGLTTAICTYIGSLFCILPGVYLQARWISTIPAIMLEPDMSAFRAIRRSYALSRDDFWRCMGVVILLAFMADAIVTASGMATSLLINLMSSALPEFESLFGAAALILGCASFILIVPFVLATVTVLYYDMRIRREGYDMAIIAEKLGLTIDPVRPVLPTPGLPKPPPSKRNWWRRKSRATAP